MSIQNSPGSIHRARFGQTGPVLSIPGGCQVDADGTDEI